MAEVLSRCAWTVAVSGRAAVVVAVGWGRMTGGLPSGCQGCCRLA